MKIKTVCPCGLKRCNLHRESKTPFYRKFLHIRNRCTFKWDKDYHNYGGRGIKFEWKTYQEFVLDMKESYDSHVKKHGVKNTTIERKNVNGNYSKRNCYWTTVQIQQKNKRTTRLLTIGKVTKNYADWAKEIGCSRQALRYRVIKGLKPELIKSLPFKHSNKYATL